MEKVALLGAAGKMGMRLARNLAASPDYQTLYVENSPDGIKRLQEAGYAVTPIMDAVGQADIVIMALPDRAINDVSVQIQPALKPKAMVVMLDPAAAYAGKLPTKDGVAYFIVHPCHTPIINDETDPAAKKDYFGGYLAKQNVVCALFKGDDADYPRGEKVAKTIFAPVMRAHRITVEQMAILEPAMVETVLATMLYGIRAAMDRVIAMGVPEAATRDFLMGHLGGEMVVVFNYVDYPMSDACLQAIKLATPKIFQPDWLDRIFDIKEIRKSAAEIIE